MTTSGTLFVETTPARTVRDAFDFYPTPHNVGRVLREWWASEGVTFGERDQFLDPAAGEGDLVRAMRDSDDIGPTFWHAFELRASCEDALEDVAENVAIVDALATEWPFAHVVANPPFALLDAFWSRIAEHRARHRVWCAVLTPVAWWNAEKRRGYVRPDVLLALGWRPTFRAKAGPAHKGSQDFAWSILAPTAKPFTEWRRVEKP